jgi:hypothetical protein
VFITAVPIIKLFAWGEGDSGGYVLRETTSRGLPVCGLVCPGHFRVDSGFGPGVSMTSKVRECVYYWSTSVCLLLQYLL